MNFQIERNGLLTFCNREPQGYYLKAGEKPLHAIHFCCDTCGDMFDLIEPIDTPLAPEEISRSLSEALTLVDEELLTSIAPLLPAGSYRVGLLSMIPDLEQSPDRVREGETNYSFKGRSVQIEKPYWYEDFANQDPESGIAPKKTGWQLVQEIERILPHRSFKTIDWRRVSYYKKLLQDREIPPTALALTISERRHPGGGNFEFTRLTHFLIDGHHKLMAAAKDNKQIQLLSLFFEGEAEVPLDKMQVRHPNEYCGRRLDPRESVSLWAQQQSRISNL